MHKLWNTISYLGHSITYALFMIILFLFDSSWNFLLLFCMLVIVTVIAVIIKLIWKTKRPRKHKKMRWWWQNVLERAFPSGHSARAAGLFTTSFISGSLIFQLLSGAFLVLVIFSRVKLKAHYWRDIVGGIVLGIIAGIAAYYLTYFLVSWYMQPEVIVYELV